MSQSIVEAIMAKAESKPAAAKESPAVSERDDDDSEIMDAAAGRLQDAIKSNNRRDMLDAIKAIVYSLR
jgi:hypothetical protein